MKEFLNQQKGKLILAAAALLAIVLLAVFLGNRGGDLPDVVYLFPDGVMFEPDSPSNGKDIKVPDNPQMPEGWIFTGWDIERMDSVPQSAEGSTEPEVVVLNTPPTDEIEEATEEPAIQTTAPQPTFKPGKTVIARAIGVTIPKDENVVALSGGYGTKDDTVTLSLKLCGKADLCAFEAEIIYDPTLLVFQEFTNDDFGIMINVLEDEGRILLNFLDTENICADVDLVDIVFKVKGGEAGKTPLSLTVSNGTKLSESGELEEVEVTAIPAAVEIV